VSARRSRGNRNLSGRMAAPVSAATVSPCPVRGRVQSLPAGISTAFPCRICVHNLPVGSPRPRSRHFPCDFPATRLRHFPRESLIASLSSGEASIVKVELAGGRASLTLTTRSEPHNRRAIHAEPEANPARTRAGCGHSRPGHGHGFGLTADADAGMARTRTRSGHGHGLDADVDWTRIRPAGRPMVWTFRVQPATTSRTQKP
jgi:hypothetical protein